MEDERLAQVRLQYPAGYIVRAVADFSTDAEGSSDMLAFKAGDLFASGTHVLQCLAISSKSQHLWFVVTAGDDLEWMHGVHVDSGQTGLIAAGFVEILDTTGDSGTIHSRGNFSCILI